MCFKFITNMKLQIVFDGNFATIRTGFEAKHVFGFLIRKIMIGAMRSLSGEEQFADLSLREKC